MSWLRLTTAIGILCGATALYAFERIENDMPNGPLAPKQVVIQLSTPSADAGAGCSPCGRMSNSTAFCVRHGVNASIATVRFAVSELATAPRHMREAVSAAGQSLRTASDVSVRTTDSALAVLYSLTADFLRIVFSSFSALGSAIWPF
jgi:hypothetical protein